MPILRTTLNENASPFNTKYAEWKAKGYVDWIGVEQRGAQIAEINRMQALNLDRNKDLWEIGLGRSNGALLTSTIPIQDGNDWTIPAGTKIYARGYIVELAEDVTITLNGSGHEFIYATIVENVYTSNDDAMLNDPATSFTDPESAESIGAPENSGEPGGHAIHAELTFSKTSGEYVIWAFTDGVIDRPEVFNDSLWIHDIETYIEDLADSYTRMPFRASIKANDNDSSYLSMPANVFYVKGHRIPKAQDTNIEIPHALTSEAAGESQAYTTGTTEYEVYEYPIKEVTDMDAYVAGYARITRGNTPDTADTVCTGTTSGNVLALMTPQIRGSLYEVEEVYTTTNGLYDGTHDVDYTIGTDIDDDCYKDGNDINWSHLTGNGATEPSGGTVYFAKIKVRVPMIPAVRTKASIENESVSVSGTYTDLAHNDVVNVIIGDTEGASDWAEGTDFEIVQHLDGYTMTDTDPNKAGVESDYAQIKRLNGSMSGTKYVTYDYWVHTKEGHYIARNSFSDVYEDAINTDALVTGQNTGYRNYISFNTVCTEKPINATSFDYEYNVYRARRDIVEIGRDEDFLLIEGNSSETPKYPEGHNQALTLCKLYIPPDSPDIIVDNVPCAAITQPQIRENKDYLQEIAARVEDIAASLTVESQFPRVDAEKGRFIETFTDITPKLQGADVHYNAGGVACTVRFDPENRCGRLGYSTHGRALVDVDIGSSSTITVGEEVITLQRSVASVANTPSSLKQTILTDWAQMNAYGKVFDPPRLSLDPAIYNWVEDNFTLQNSQVGSSNFSTTIFGPADEQFPITRVEFLLGTPTTGGTVDQRQVNLGFFQTFERAAAFINPTTVTVYGSKFSKSATVHVYVEFDGQRVTLTPVAPTTGHDGMVHSSTSGTWEATFTVPSGTPVGVKSVQAFEVETALESNPTSFTARGIIRERVPMPPPMPVLPRRTDPIGNTFTPMGNYDIGAFSLWAKQKSGSEGGTFFLRQTRDGDPQEENQGSHPFASGDITVSTLGTVASQLSFTDPMKVDNGVMYFAGLSTNSPDYLIGYAKLGGTDLRDSTVKASENAYPDGTMCVSADAATWLPDPNSDLTFCCHPYVYAASGTIIWENYVQNATSFAFDVEYELRPGSSINWFYSTDVGTTWTAFMPNQTVRLASQATQIQIKAVLYRGTQYTSPWIFYKTATIWYGVNSSSSKYISKNIANATGREYHTLHIAMQYCTPAGTAVALYVSKDDGSTWDAVGAFDRTRQIDGEYTEGTKDLYFTIDPPTLAANDLADSGVGTLADDTYYYIVTATNDEGETIGSTERSITTSGSNSAVTIDMTGNWPTGATGYKLYRGTDTGKCYQKYIGGTTPTTITDDGSDDDGGNTLTPPTVNTAYDVQDNMRIRIDMSTSDVAVEPKIRNIIVMEE